MAEFEIAGLTAKAGELVRGHLGHVTLNDGTQVGVPTAIVNGVEDGPTLVVAGSVHGSEVVGVGSVVEVIRNIEPQRLKGRLIAITVANPFAFQTGAYTNPYDGKNLSSPIFWPANPEGTLTERIAAIISPAIKTATHLIDVHANPYPSIDFVLANFNVARDDATRNETRRIAEAWGTTVIENPQQQVRSLRDIGVAHGIPALTPELTGNRYLREETVRVGTIGITNVMKTIGMLEGEIEEQPVKKLQGDFVARGRLTTNTGGLMWVREAPGTFLKKGDLVVEMIDVWGRTVEEIRMPLDGYCWSFTGGLGGSHAVAEGAQVAYMFSERDVQ